MLKMIQHYFSFEFVGVLFPFKNWWNKDHVIKGVLLEGCLYMIVG